MIVSTVQDILAYGSAELKQEIQELSEVVDVGPFRRGVIPGLSRWKFEENVSKWEKRNYSLMVVSVLIATVTFAAAFTMPGGYQNEEGTQQGTSVLIRNAAFQAFVITDAIAMMFSLSAIFAHIFVSIGASTFFPLINYSPRFTLISMVAMILAFVTGTYAVLAPSSGLAIATCTICLSFFPSTIYLFYKMVKDWAESGP
ncbi:hypothetical protein Patl1_10460 [Pistacia atlantica]|uniref:Uncharacterized protein n=1 Tax=Pistacia atlantica TaxID=434234 RepID=A0ACC1A8Q6_9ROSI|nr:hypothetical protein Patl1_10460 [Pistacia atlantica]